MSGNLWLAGALGCLGVGAFAVYMVARVLKASNAVLAFLTSLCLGASLAALLRVWPSVQQVDITSGTASTWGWAGPGGASLRAEPSGLLVACVAVSLGLLVAVYSGRYLSLDQRYEAYYPLLLLLVLGLMGMVLTADLFNLYLFCELMGIASYALVAFRRRTETAIEAGFKYLVMGSVGTVTLLYGIGAIYRATGSTALGPGAAEMPEGWGAAGLACILVGLAIKSAIVPVHTWLPDAHGRAPSSISAMLSGIVIQSSFFAMLRTTLLLGLSPATLGTLLVWASLPTMIVGNVMGLVQTNGKRMLAYSSVAQMGYLMLAIGYGLRYSMAEAIQAGLFLLMIHAAMKALAFLCKGVCHFYCDATTIAELRGMVQRTPVTAIAFGLALASLPGVPPLGGFAAKWFILRPMVNAPDGLAVAGLILFLLNSLLSLGYYLPVLATLYQPSEEGNVSHVRVSRWMSAPIAALAAVVIGIGLAPGPWLGWVEVAGRQLLALGGGPP